jgi:hypothetical protein
VIKKNFKKNIFLLKNKITKTFFFVPQFRILFSGIPQKVEKNLKFRFLGRKMDFPLFRSFHIPQKSKNIPWNSARGIRFLVPTKISVNPETTHFKTTQLDRNHQISSH